MKTLSDYKDEEAIELWADLIEPVSHILQNKEFTSGLKGKPYIIMAKEILKEYKTETAEILKRISGEAIDGFNVLLTLVQLLADIGRNPEIISFFGSAEQGISESESSGSDMGNTEDGEN